MKLLIITQKVDLKDGVLGFFHSWIAKLAEKFDKITVICLYKGEYHLPKNVTVISLGKEEGVSKINYLIRFYSYIWKYRKDYDAVFVHMNQIYVILGGLIWKSIGKKIGLWYAHGKASLSLRLSEKITDVIFTSTKFGCNIKSKKIRVINQGIDTDLFKPSGIKRKEKVYQMITIGRISPVKDYETIINAVSELNKDNVELKIIGLPGSPEQENYLLKLKRLVKEKNLDKKIKFMGEIPNKDIIRYLNDSDLFINLSQTKSLDKAILEAMSCGLLVLTSNDSAKAILNKKYENLCFEGRDAQELSQKIMKLITLPEKKKEIMRGELRKMVVKNHNIEKLVESIKNIYSKI